MLDRCSRDLCDLAPPRAVILLTQNLDLDRQKWGSLALKKRRCTNLTPMEAIANPAPAIGDLHRRNLKVV
jgi:hypothetical protein